MPRTLNTLLALATLSATASLLAQYGAQAAYSADPANTGSSYTDSYTQPAAPIERPDNGYGQAPPPNYTQQQPTPQNHTSQPAAGIWLITAPDASVQTVSATPGHTELRLDHGRVNVNIHHPADRSEILVDLPGGQVSLLKDGLYTFNAETGTVRVLRGEAEVSLGNAKPIKVKEEHQLVLAASGARSQEADHNELRADLLQGNYGQPGGYRHGDGYGEGFYGYPYAGYAYGWPYYGFGYGPGWGYPYYAFGYGYPYGYGFGLGFGYYGGFRGGYGGFRGGFRR